MNSRLPSLLLFILALSGLSHAQPYKLLKQIATGADDEVNYVKIDSRKNIIIAGNINGLLQLGANQLNYSGGFMAKFDSAGNNLWVIPAGMNNPGNQGRSDLRNPMIVLDQNDNMYVSGYYSAMCVIGTDTLFASTTWNCFLAKIDPNGNVLWSKHVGNGLAGNDMEIDSASNLYLTGIATGIVTIDTIVIPTLGSCDAYLAKFDSTGNIIWAKRAGGTDSNGEGGSSVAVDVFGNVFMSGYIRSNAEFDSLVLPSTGGTHFDGFLAKYNSSGQIQWVEYAGNHCDEIETDMDGNCYAIGYRLQAALYIFKFNSSGDTVATRNLIGYFYGIDIELDEDGTVFLAGHYRDTLRIDSVELRGCLCPPQGVDANTFVLVLDSSLHATWGKTVYSCQSKSWGFGLDVSGCNVAVCGMITESPPAVYFDNDSLTSIGGNDGYFFMLDSCSMTTAITTADVPDINVSVYPNPASNSVTVTFKNPGPGKMSLTIQNVFGQEIIGDEVSSSESINTKNIETGHLPAGVYFLIVNIEESKIVKKIIKE